LKTLKKISLLLLLSSTMTLASIPIKNTPVPGGIAVIDFKTNTFSCVHLKKKSCF
jgi:hypothetical protein